MSRARFSADAEADLLAIVEFIAQDNPNAARESPQKTEALLRHARVDRVERVIRPYLESLA